MPLDRAYIRLGSAMQAFQHFVSWRQARVFKDIRPSSTDLTHMADPLSEKCKHSWDVLLCQGKLIWNTVLTCDAQESSEAVQIVWNTSLQLPYIIQEFQTLYEPAMWLSQDTSGYHIEAPPAKKTSSF